MVATGCGSDMNAGRCENCDGMGFLGPVGGPLCEDCFGWGVNYPPKGCGQPHCSFPKCGPASEWSCGSRQGVHFWSGKPVQHDLDEVPF